MLDALTSPNTRITNNRRMLLESAIKGEPMIMFSSFFRLATDPFMSFFQFNYEVDVSHNDMFHATP